MKRIYNSVRIYCRIISKYEEKSLDEKIVYIYILLLMNKTIVMKRRRIGIMLNSLDDDGIMIEMIIENVMRRDIGQKI